MAAGFGFASDDQASQPEALLFLADRALYRHKGPRLVVTQTPGPS